MNRDENNRPALLRLAKRSAILIILLLLAVLAGNFYNSKWEYGFLTRRVERVVAGKTELLTNQIDNIKNDGINASSLRSESHSMRLPKLRKEGITLLVYADSSLVFWSDNSFDVPLTPFTRNRNDKLVPIQNGFFLKEKVEYSDTIIIGLLRIYGNYDIENKLLRNGFPDFLGLPHTATISTTPELSDYHVNGPDGGYLFSIIFPVEKENTLLIIMQIGRAHV